MAPDAAFCVQAPRHDPGRTGATLYFFRRNEFACWDVAGEALLPGYPRAIAQGFPGLLEAFPGKALRGALHVPEWGAKAYFFFEGERDAVVWDLDQGATNGTVDVAGLLPGRLAAGDFTPAYAQLADGRGVVYAFSGREYTRFAIEGGVAREEPGFPRPIDADWKDGLVLAPRAAVYVDWPSRSVAHSNRKLYFFMGDLYLRWDVPSHTRNYRLDIASGWKGWPAFA